MKKIIGILLSLCMVMCFMPSFAFADGIYDEVTLKMEFSNGDCSFGADLWSGSPEKIKFVKEFRKGDDAEKVYITDSSELKSSSDNITITYKGNNEFEVTINRNLKSEEEYDIEYVGKEQLDNTSVHVMAHSSGQQDFLNKVGFNKVKAKYTNKGNVITWKTAKTGFPPDQYVIYRSTSKNKGYKLLGMTSGSTKTYTDKSGITKGKTYYYKICAKVNFSFGAEKSKYAKVASCKAKATLKKYSAANDYNTKVQSQYKDHTLLNNAADFGLSKNIKWINNPKTDKQLENNMLYSMLIGNYSLEMAFDSYSDAEKAKDFYSEQVLWFKMAHAYCDLASYALGSGSNFDEFTFNVEQKDDVFVFSMDMKIDFDKLFKEYVQAYKAAKLLHKKLHDDGIVEEGMTDMEVAKAINKAICHHNTGFGTDGQGVPNGMSKMEFYHNDDTIYGFFVNCSGTCGSRAAGLQMLMHLEGIKCFGIHIKDHIVNIFPYQGELYVADAQYDDAIMTVDEAKKSNKYHNLICDFPSNDYYIDYVKTILGK